MHSSRFAARNVSVLPAIAAELGVSYSHLRQTFTERIGLSPETVSLPGPPAEGAGTAGKHNAFCAGSRRYPRFPFRLSAFQAVQGAFRAGAAALAREATSKRSPQAGKSASNEPQMKHRFAQMDRNQRRPRCDGILHDHIVGFHARPTESVSICVSSVALILGSLHTRRSAGAPGGLAALGKQAAYHHQLANVLRRDQTSKAAQTVHDGQRRETRFAA